MTRMYSSGGPTEKTLRAKELQDQRELERARERKQQEIQVLEKKLAALKKTG